MQMCSYYHGIHGDKVLVQSRQNKTDHPKLLLREESGKDTASVWVLIKLNQIYLASLLAVLVQLSLVQIKSRCRRSVSTAQPLLSHPSAAQIRNLKNTQSRTGRQCRVIQCPLPDSVTYA